jgi:hypothetical protein
MTAKKQTASEWIEEHFKADQPYTPQVQAAMKEVGCTYKNILKCLSRYLAQNDLPDLRRSKKFDKKDGAAGADIIPPESFLADVDLQRKLLTFLDGVVGDSYIYEGRLRQRLSCSASRWKDLRRLPESELQAVAAELRDYLVQTVSRRGGHFAAGLGTVELTVALHYVFDTPHDRLVWDVGHQAYPHKVLTGRRDRLATIKHKGGLAPFPARSESEYDPFGAAHSSTSISAALGFAVANQLKGEPGRGIAVIGDGAMSAGQAFEALNHAGALDTDGLEIDAADLAELLRVDVDGWRSAIGEIREHFDRFEPRLPGELKVAVDRLETALTAV